MNKQTNFKTKMSEVYGYKLIPIDQDKNRIFYVKANEILQEFMNEEISDIKSFVNLIQIELKEKLFYSELEKFGSLGNPSHRIESKLRHKIQDQSLNNLYHKILSNISIFVIDKNKPFCITSFIFTEYSDIQLGDKFEWNSDLFLIPNDYNQPLLSTDGQLEKLIFRPSKIPEEIYVNGNLSFSTNGIYQNEFPKLIHASGSIMIDMISYIKLESSDCDIQGIYP